MGFRSVLRLVKDALFGEPPELKVRSLAMPFLIHAPPEVVAPLLGDCMSSTWDPFVCIHQLMKREGYALPLLRRPYSEEHPGSWLPPSPWPPRGRKLVYHLEFELYQDGKAGRCVARCYHQLRRRATDSDVDDAEYEVTVELHATARGWDDYMRPYVAQQSALMLGAQLKDAAERRAQDIRRNLPAIVVHSAG
ncbi:hypothetical protein PsYK624_090490 [Phanerochaete sordida]|uniref:Uncharacterized protein n=1 Tax=Phanerochaete sordida TaxID=48140 RepID=A0A9P3LEU6_9APHY|nr:hypothetical protein PsYK624_090490 [Phanerochaete sordida]